MIEIKRYDNGEVLHSIHGDDIKACLEDAAANSVSLFRADLRGKDFSYANLNGLAMMDCLCVGANFTGADLTNVDFGSSDLSAAILTAANMTGIRIIGCKLDYAHLPYSAISVNAGRGFPMFICKDGVQVGSFATRPAEDWLNMSLDQAAEEGGITLMDNLVAIQRIVQYFTQ